VLSFSLLFQLGGLMQIARMVAMFLLLVSVAAFAQTETDSSQVRAQTESQSQRRQQLRQRRDKMMQEMKSDVAQMRSMLEKMRAEAQKVKDQSAKAALLQNADMWQALLDNMQEKMDRMDSALLGRPRRNRVRTATPQQVPAPANPAPE
jgi:phage terminase small subunit